MQGLARTLRCETVEKYSVPDDDFLLERLLPWIVRHSSWLLSRFQIHTDGGERVREIFDKVRGLPWNPSGRVEPTVKSHEPPPVQPPTTRREYLREFGKTANCRACEGIPGRHHTKFCQDRFEAWQKERGFSGVPTDQRDTVEKDPVSEPVMNGDLLDPEVAGSTFANRTW